MGLVAVPVLLAGSAGVLAAPTVPIRPAAVVTFSGDLSSAAATSASNAWAVGFTGSFSSPKPLILHWNGASWRRMPNPARTGGDQLAGVAATSASRAWAVGCAGCSTSTTTTVILRWNGAAWKRVPSPSLPGSSRLSSVAAPSANRAWAVGTSGASTLILRWNGTVWKRVPSPSPGARSSLASVTAISARDAWAVGDVNTRGTSFTRLILHWNGKIWTRASSPSPKYGKYGNALQGVAASSAANVWAVGCTDGCPVGGNPVIARWNGTAWKQVAAPTTPYSLYGLGAVVAISTTNAWAVGGSGPVTDESATAAHWNGHRWRLSKGVSGAVLTGVAATSATNAWAVGGTVHGRTLILHWNGTTWKPS